MKKIKVFFTACAMITGVIIMSSFFQHKDMKHWESPKSADLIKNPLKGNITATQKGKILFENQCVACHGSKGKGDGPGSVALEVRPADLTSEMTQSHTDGALYWKIMKGNKPMPSFKEAHKVDHNQCWQLIDYIRELGSAQNKKGMDMSKTNKSTEVQKKKTPVKATKKTGKMKNMKMPVSKEK
jgi:mono/diheme cytochrome c family protein